MRADDVLSWLPSWVSNEDTQRVEVTTFVPPDAEHRWVCQRPLPERWGSVAAGLRRAGDRLKQTPVLEIVEAIDRVAERWCDQDWPRRRAVRARISALTGFSEAEVDRSLGLELRNYRADSLLRTLRRELGDPRCLDEPRGDRELQGMTMAVGPDLVLAVLTGNVPGLPALSIVRSLLVKSPVIAKVASGEPSFAAAFAESLFEEHPALGEAVLVTYWARDERSILEQIAREADVVIAYGGDDACRSVREALPQGVRLVEHGHKLSVGFISASYLSREGAQAVALAIARDVATFNQHACIAPQAYFVEGTSAEVRSLAAAIGDALSEQARTYPIGKLRTLDAANVRLARSQQGWRAATSATHDVWHDAGLEWTVALDERLMTPSGLGHRFLRVIPVGGLPDMIEQLRPMRAYLQNVGLGCTETELVGFTAELARLGASRICEPGRMPEPSMMWRHDGRVCVAELVRWCDVEMHRCSSERSGVDG